ncbi:MAG: hypothetical protein ACO3BG_02540 [Candidatus Nanopelagicales bacterium]
MKFVKIDKSQISHALYICIIPMVSSLYIGELLTFLFVFSLIYAFFKQPKKISQIWLTSVFLLWIVYGLAGLIGLIPLAGEEGSGETIWSFGFESFIFMFFLVLIPTFIGRFIGQKFKPASK